MLLDLADLAMRLSTRFGGCGVIVNEHVLPADHTRQHVEWLWRAFDFISLGELHNHLMKRRARPFCLLTFDDGKRSQATVTAPELVRLGVPAVFFVPTGPVSHGTLLPGDRHAALLAALGKAPEGLESTVVKRLAFAELVQRIDRACAHYGVDANLKNDDVSPMSWDEVRGLQRLGFDIGAHGVTHAILTNEAATRAREEIRDSLNDVSRETGRPCTTFAFPNGNYTPELAKVCTACGATTVMTTDPTYVRHTSPLWRLPRLQLSRDLSPSRICLKLTVGSVGRILENPDGSGRAYSRDRSL
jgi:peptidoglycan/xylan/chitin deacetylase (PgdA/CDA1 family)